MKQYKCLQCRDTGLQEEDLLQLPNAPRVFELCGACNGNFPDAIEHKGRWCEKDGKMYKSVEYHGGCVRWVAEGTVMHSGPYAHVANTYRLRYRGFQVLVEKLRGGPLHSSSEAFATCPKREGE